MSHHYSGPASGFPDGGRKDVLHAAVAEMGQRTHCGVMDGGGHCSQPTHLTSRCRLISRKIASTVMS
jgi:hypothetical protein